MMLLFLPCVSLLYPFPQKSLLFRSYDLKQVHDRKVISSHLDFLEKRATLQSLAALCMTFGAVSVIAFYVRNLDISLPFFHSDRQSSPMSLWGFLVLKPSV